MGEAYGFFDCSATKEAIEVELPTIRRLVRTPSELELSLIEGMDNIQVNVGSVFEVFREDSRRSKLISLIEQAKQSGMRYVLGATNPVMDNISVADELAGILNQAYQSPLYKEEERFSGAIIYERNGVYVFRE